MLKEEVHAEVGVERHDAKKAWKYIQETPVNVKQVDEQPPSSQFLCFTFHSFAFP